jgi:hypothetical protein
MNKRVKFLPSTLAEEADNQLENSTSFDTEQTRAWQSEIESCCRGWEMSTTRKGRTL